MFGGAVLAVLYAPAEQAVIERVETLLRSHLYDGGQWSADYRRLRLVAIKPS